MHVGSTHKSLLRLPPLWDSQNIAPCHEIYTSSGPGSQYIAPATKSCACHKMFTWRFTSRSLPRRFLNYSRKNPYVVWKHCLGKKIWIRRNIYIICIYIHKGKVRSASNMLPFHKELIKVSAEAAQRVTRPSVGSRSRLSRHNPAAVACSAVALLKMCFGPSSLRLSKATRSDWGSHWEFHLSTRRSFTTLVESNSVWQPCIKFPPPSLRLSSNFRAEQASHA